MPLPLRWGEGMSRNTVEAVIERVRRQLNSALRQESNFLTADIDNAVTSFVLEFDLTPAIQFGAVLSIGKELMRVTAFDSVTKQVTVKRGWQDSDAESHSTGDEVLINPRFTRYDIYDALIDEVSSWSPDLFKVESYQWDVVDNQETVELPASLSDAIGLVRLERNYSHDDSTAWPTLKYRLSRGDVGTWDGVSLSGMLIRLVPRHNHYAAGKVHAVIARPFDVSSGLAESVDLVSTTGLQPSMIDLLVLGIKLRMLTDDENVRGNRQPASDSRSMQDMNDRPLEHAQTVRGTYLRRYLQEVTKLRGKYPMRAW